MLRINLLVGTAHPTFLRGLTRLVDRLEVAGLICREACEIDRRGAFAVITDEGIAMLDRM